VEDEKLTDQEKDDLGLIRTHDDVPAVDRTKYTETDKEYRIAINRKHTDRLYPCTICGKEKVKQSRTGNIPLYCKDCLKGVQVANLKKARIAQYRDKAYEATIDVLMPDGSYAKVRDEREKKFLDDRFKSYLDEFDWKESADYGLLSKLLLLELQTNRLSHLLTLKYTDSKAVTLGKLTDEIRQCQHDLGIARLKRIDEKDTADAYTIVQGMIKRFNEYKEKFPERFMWKCVNCGQINSTDIENKDGMCSVIRTGESNGSIINPQ